MAQPDSPKRQVGLKLAYIARQLRQRFDEKVDEIGLSRAKFGVIAVTARKPGVTQRKIAEALQVTEVTAGRLIERLCADGYLERRANSSDRRAHCVYLTPAAQPVLDQLSTLATVQEDEAFAGFDGAELDLFNTFLDRLAENLGSPPLQPAGETQATALCESQVADL